MKIGKITSIADGPKRDVELRISSTEFFSEISDPPETIKPSEVIRYEVVEKKRRWRASLYFLYVCLNGERRVLFYTAQGSFDLILLLDEMDASLPNVPRTKKKA